MRRPFLMQGLALVLSFLTVPVKLKSNYTDSEIMDNFISSTVYTSLEYDGDVIYNKSETGSISVFAITLHDTIKDVGELMQGLVHNLVSNVPEISPDTVLLQLKDRIANVLKVFTSEIIDAGDALVRDAFQRMQTQLLQVKDEIQKMVSNVDEQLDWTVLQLNETLMNNTENYDEWMAHIKQKLRSVNDTKLYNESCRIVDEFIQRSTEKLQSCCNITIKPMRSMCRKARALIAEVLRILADVLDRMQTCLEDKQSYLEYMMPCINVAYDEVSALIERASQMRRKIGSMLPMKILYSRCCISVVIVEMRQDQHRVNNELRTKHNLNNNNKNL